MISFIERTGVFASVFTLLASTALAQSGAFQTTQTATATNAPGAVQTVGCYSKVDGFVDLGAWTFQSSGYCQVQCSNGFKNVMATTGGSDCLCGDDIPSDSVKVSNSSCDTPCQGFDAQMCGGTDVYTVYLTGLDENLPVDGGSSSTATTSGSSKGGSSTSTASPSVITKGGQTVYLTATSTPTGSGSGGGSSKVGIAVGVVVGILAIAAIVGGVVIFLKQRKRRAVEEEFRRNAQVEAFTRAAKSETSSANDERLDHSVFAHKRQSIGSIADERDFSRRILQVRNPDGV